MSIEALAAPAARAILVDDEAEPCLQRVAAAARPGTLVFFRGGAVLAQGGGLRRVVDANHVLAGPPGVLVPLTPRLHCTVVMPAAEHGTVAPGVHACSSALYLAHWILLNRACDRASAAADILNATATLTAGSPRAPLPSAQAQRVGVHVSTALHDASNRRLSLDAMAASLGLSRFTVSHLFTEYAGMTLRTYHRRLRMRLALELLRERPVPLTALALELGFSDQAHFSNTFHAEYGVAPSVLRGSAALSRAMIRNHATSAHSTMES